MILHLVKLHMMLTQPPSSASVKARELYEDCGAALEIASLGLPDHDAERADNPWWVKLADTVL